MAGFSPDQLIVLGVFVMVMVAFASERLRPELVAWTGVGTLLVAGILTTKDVLDGFSNQGVFTVGAMFVLSAALERTGCIEALGQTATRLVGGRPRLAVAGLCLTAVFISAFINNTPVVVILTPVAIRLCQSTGAAPSKMLIPLSYAAIFGGTCTLIGTSTNLVVDGVVQRLGLPPFSMFEITAFGTLMALIGLTYLMTIGHFLLPVRETAGQILGQPKERRYLAEMVVRDGSSLAGKSLAEAKLTSLASGARVVDVIRGLTSFRRQLTDLRLEVGDRIVIKVPGKELMELRQRADVVFSQKGDLEPVATQDSVVVEGLVGPRSDFVGRRLSELQLRRRYAVYILAVHRQGVNLKRGFETVDLEVGDLIMLEGPPEGVRQLMDSGDLVNLTAPEYKPMRREKAWIAAGAVLSVVTLASFNVMPIAGLAVLAVLLVLLTGCVELDDAYRAIEWRILFLIIGLLAFGLALERTGLAERLGNAIQPLEPVIGAAGVLSLVYLTASIMTEVISNNAVAVVLTPIAVSIASALGLDPRPFVVAVMFGASASFATPIGYQTNTFVYSAGGYRYLDFVKVGLPLNIIFWIGASFLIPIFWPLVPASH